jgi:hypothetical protein
MVVVVYWLAQESVKLQELGSIPADRPMTDYLAA